MSAASSFSDRLVIVVSGPGGVGKGTIVERVMARDDGLWLSRSWTTRTRRPGESSDAYNFVSRDQFDSHIEAGGFLEWVDFLDYRQGTPLPDPPPGLDIVFEIDVHGGLAIAEAHPDPLLLFVDAPDREAQRRRLVGRGDPPDKVEARLLRGDEERALAVGSGYRTLINDDLDEAVEAVLAVVAEERRRRCR
ncbi:MAG: guanylate kinase [Acidimicrobiia bacterium]|nr:guanylate kinase [Acidimicrobiia bacterium]